MESTEGREQRCMVKFKQTLNAQRGSTQGTRRPLGQGPCSGCRPQSPLVQSSIPTTLTSDSALLSRKEDQPSQKSKHWQWHLGLTVPHQAGSSFWCLHLLTEMCHQWQLLMSSNCPVIALLSSAFHKSWGAHRTAIRVSSTWDLRTAASQSPGLPVPQILSVSREHEDKPERSKGTGERGPGPQAATQIPGVEHS